MTTEETLKKIFATTYTKTDGFRRLMVLRDFFDHITFSIGASPGALSDELRVHYAGTPDASTAEAIAAWGEEVLKSAEKDSGRSLIEAMQKEMADMPELVLYVAAGLSVSGVAALGAWCRANIDPNLLIEMHTDQGAAGGCRFVWKSQYYDYSLAYFVDKHRDEVQRYLQTHA